MLDDIASFKFNKNGSDLLLIQVVSLYHPFPPLKHMYIPSFHCSLPTSYVNIPKSHHQLLPYLKYMSVYWQLYIDIIFTSITMIPDPCNSFQARCRHVHKDIWRHHCNIYWHKAKTKVRTKKTSWDSGSILPRKRIVSSLVNWDHLGEHKIDMDDV